MKLRILCILAFLAFAAPGCEKNNILDIKTTYCIATINGQEYKDATTVREELARRGYPFAIKERIFIGINNNLAYIQFKLSDANGKMCYYLFGGIPFADGENFPVLNKEYRIYCHPNFDITGREEENIADDYLEFQTKETSSMYPSGILVLKKYSDITSSSYETPHSLPGIVRFTEFNQTNKKYSGNFILQGNDDIEGKHYRIGGELKSTVAQGF